MEWSQTWRSRGAPKPQGPLSSPWVSASLRFVSVFAAAGPSLRPTQRALSMAAPTAPTCTSAALPTRSRLVRKGSLPLRYAPRGVLAASCGVNASSLIPRVEHTHGSSGSLSPYSEPLHLAPSASPHPDLRTRMFPVSPCRWTKGDRFLPAAGRGCWAYTTGGSSPWGQLLASALQRGHGLPTATPECP